jgi:hypothetical protein
MLNRGDNKATVQINRLNILPRTTKLTEKVIDYMHAMEAT